MHIVLSRACFISLCADLKVVPFAYWSVRPPLCVGWKHKECYSRAASSEITAGTVTDATVGEVG